MRTAAVPSAGAWTIAAFTLSFAAGWQFAIGGGAAWWPGWVAAAEALAVLGLEVGLCWLAALALVRRDVRRDALAALFACVGLLGIDAYSWGGSGGDVGFDVHTWQRSVAGVEAVLLMAAVGLLLLGRSSRAFRAVLALELTIFLLANTVYVARDGLEARALRGFNSSPLPIIAVTLGLALRLALLRLSTGRRSSTAPQSVEVGQSP